MLSQNFLRYFGALATAGMLASCAQYIHPPRQKHTNAAAISTEPMSIAECLNPKPSSPAAKAQPGVSPEFQKVENPEQLPLASLGGNLENFKAALKIQQAFCAETQKLPAKSSKFGDCELSSQQWCAQMGQEMLDLANNSQSMAELAAKVKDKFDWYQFHGGKGKDDFLFTGYYSPLYEASRLKTEEYRYPIYAQPPELFSAPDGANPSKRVWRMLNQDGEPVPYLTNQAIEHDVLANRNLVIAYLKDPTQPIDLKIEGSGNFLIHEPDGTVKNAYINYAAGNGHPLRTPARVMRCLGYPRSVWGTQKKVFDYLRNHPDEFAEVRGRDPSHVFYAEQEEGPFGVNRFLLYPEVSVATDPNYLPTGVLALYSAEAESEDSSSKDKVQKTRLAIASDIGGAIKSAHVDIFTGAGEKANADTERFTGAGNFYVPVPKNCGR